MAESRRGRPLDGCREAERRCAQPRRAAARRLGEADQERHFQQAIEGSVVLAREEDLRDCVVASSGFSSCSCWRAAAGAAATPRPPGPAIERATAERLASKSDAIADALDGGDVCGAASRRRAERSGDRGDQRGRIPPVFQEHLQARSNGLVNTVNCPPPPRPGRRRRRARQEGQEEEKAQAGRGRPRPPPTVAVDDQ